MAGSATDAPVALPVGSTHQIVTAAGEQLVAAAMSRYEVRTASAGEEVRPVAADEPIGSGTDRRLSSRSPVLDINILHVNCVAFGLASLAVV